MLKKAGKLFHFSDFSCLAVEKCVPMFLKIMPCLSLGVSCIPAKFQGNQAISFGGVGVTSQVYHISWCAV